MVSLHCNMLFNIEFFSITAEQFYFSSISKQFLVNAPSMSLPCPPSKSILFSTFTFIKPLKLIPSLALHVMLTRLKPLSFTLVLLFSSRFLQCFKGYFTISQPNTNCKVKIEVSSLGFHYQIRCCFFNSFREKAKIKNYTEFPKSWGNFLFLVMGRQTVTPIILFIILFRYQDSSSVGRHIRVETIQGIEF